jgi:hypothetical protein
MKNVKGGGVLFVEPAFKSASQRVSQIRDELMPRPIWGPCFHQQKCPLADGRDWCHFSVPVTLPGKFFKKFSVKLGSVRDWLKFSFVWIAADADHELVPSSPQSKLGLARVVSDPMKTPRGNQNQICEPVQIKWLSTPRRPIFRGEVIAGSDLVTPVRSEIPRGRPQITPKEKVALGMKSPRNTQNFGTVAPETRRLTREELRAKEREEKRYAAPYGNRSSKDRKDDQPVSERKRKITDTRDSPEQHPALRAKPKFKPRFKK